MWLSQLNAKPLKVNILETEAASATQPSPQTITVAYLAHTIQNHTRGPRAGQTAPSESSDSAKISFYCYYHQFLLTG